MLSSAFLLQSGTMDPSLSQLEGTAGETTAPAASSEMKESASLELDPSISVGTAKEPEKSATMPAESLRSQAVLLEGTLSRKHDVEGSGKKASNRCSREDFWPFCSSSVHLNHTLYHECRLAFYPHLQIKMNFLVVFFTS